MPPIKKTVKGFTGIGPRSGLGRAFGARIQRGRFLGWMGLGPRVLKFDGAFGPEGCGGGCAAVFIMPPSAVPLHHFVVPLPPTSGGRQV